MRPALQGAAASVASTGTSSRVTNGECIQFILVEGHIAKNRINRVSVRAGAGREMSNDINTSRAGIRRWRFLFI